MNEATDIEAAREAGATEEQLAVLREARDSGAVTFEAYNEAVDRALRCLREADVAAHDHGISEHLGLQMRLYSVPVDAEAEDEREPLPGYTVHRCIAVHSFWVERAYQRQPSSGEAQAEHFARHRDAIIQCLIENGVELDPDLGPTPSELDLEMQIGSDEQGLEVWRHCVVESRFTR